MAGQRGYSNIDVDADAFMDGLQAEMARMVLKSEQSLLRLAIDVQNKAKIFCPVKSGRLKGSITHAPGRDAIGPYVTVGTNVEYAGHVEYGTSKQRAQPYMRPALAEAIMSWQRIAGAK